MASLPNLDADVFFGDAEKPLPNWRHWDEPSDDDDEPTPEDRKAVVAVLGFDPNEIEGYEPQPHHP